MSNGKDILTPAQLRQNHFDRMLRRMMADSKEVEKVIRRAVKLVGRKEKENA